MTTALVIGRARGVWEEIAVAQALTTFDHVLAVGPIAVDYPGPIDCWVWFHTEFFPEYAERRAKKGFVPAHSYWSVKYKGRERGKEINNVHYLDWDEGGSSGLVAVMIALNKLRDDHVVLAGIPMTVEGGQYDSDKLWNDALPQQLSWTKNLPHLEGKVKSFSGWTNTLLGTPTVNWLNEVSHANAA